MNSEMTRKALNDWRMRAISSGYIQEIEPDASAHPVVEVSTGWGELGSNGIESDVRAEGLKTFSIVARTTPLPALNLHGAGPSNSSASAGDVRKMLLDEIETGSHRLVPWPAFCLRLLGILKQECLRLDFRVAAAQIDRIEATEESDADLARELLRDLRTRMSDEERVSLPVGKADDHPPELLRAMVSEIEVSVLDAIGDTSCASSPWPAHCSRLLATVRDGCAALGLRLTSTQVDRVEDAVTNGACQLRDVIRELGNRMLDELEYAGRLACLLSVSVT
jgi:hypothetical protein